MDTKDWREKYWQSLQERREEELNERLKARYDELTERQAWLENLNRRMDRFFWIQILVVVGAIVAALSIALFTAS